MGNVLIVTALAGFVRSFLENDIRILKSKGYNVYVAANKDHPGVGEIERYFKEIGVQFINAPFISNKILTRENLRSYRILRKLIAENDFKLIHVHTPIAGSLARMAARKTRKNGCRVVYTAHGFYFHEKSDKKTYIIFKLMETLMSYFTDDIITINREDFLAASKMHCRARYISGVGVDTKKFGNVSVDKDKFRKALGIEKNDIMVVSVGELSARKNHKVIIKALGYLNDSRYVYCICGNDMNEGGTSNELRRLADREHVRLKLLGLRDDIPKVLACADIGAFPSSREGLGLAGIEMLASGMPIVSSNVQGIKDYCKYDRTGFPCDADDFIAFAEGIQKLSDPAKREGMADDCRRMAAKFDYRVTYSQMDRHYAEILGEKKPLKVFHYSLGTAPYRTGGMTKYCSDLIMEESREGVDAVLLWPGRIRWRRGNTRLKNLKNEDGIRSIEIKNPQPVPLNMGIKDTEPFMGMCKNPEVFDDFFDREQPDIIHIHTLMGIYPEMLESAKNHGIRLVYTTHDYYGLCPRVNLFKNGEICSGPESCEGCSSCNTKALDRWKIVIIQSHIYKILKNWAPVRFIRRNFKEKFFEDGAETDRNRKRDEQSGSRSKDSDDRRKNYIRLREYYISMLLMMDVMHYNSTISRDIYEKLVPQMKDKGRLIEISHSDIKDERRRIYPKSKLKIGYFSLPVDSKGFCTLISVLDEMWKDGEKWFELVLYEDIRLDRPYARNHRRYGYENLSSVYSGIDVMMLPSLWPETFGFVVLEALNFGIPSVVSDMVGAKDLLENGKYGIVYHGRDGMKEALMSLKGGEVIMDLNRRICEEMDMDHIINSHADIIKMYGELKNSKV